MSFYTAEESWESGAIHLAEGENASKDLLVVFVHGIRTDYKSTWTINRVPERILERAKLDTDVLVLAHPSCIYHRASVEASANLLRDRIATAFAGQTHRNVVFVTHSLGGLVVKQLLCDEGEPASQSLQIDSLGSSETQSLWSRTRLVINIDTPHMGGIGALAVLYPLYAAAIRPVMWSVSWVPVYFRLKCWPWGTDHQLKQLKTNGPFVISLETRYRNWCRKFSEANLPCPVRFDFIASVMNTVHRVEGHKVVFDRSTSEIATTPESDQYEKVVSGDHAKAIEGAIAPIGAVLKKYYEDHISCFVSERTLALLLYTREIRVDQLLKSQQELLTALKAEATAVPFAWAAKIAVLESDAGLGKSTIARTLARHCALDRLKYATGPKVVLVGLQRLTTKAALGTASEVWQEILGILCEFANDFSGAYPSISPQWIHEQLQTSHLVLILDGLEEFLMNSPQISREAVLGLAEHIFNTYGQNQRLFVVITLRLSWFTEYERSRVALGGPRKLLGEPTDDDLKAVFPYIDELLKATAKAPPEARRLVRSPLIASILRISSLNDSEESARPQLQNEADVYEFALFARCSTLSIPTPVAAKVLCEIARLLGWEMFRRWGKPVNAANVSQAVLKRAFKWYKHVRDLGHEALAESAASIIEPVMRMQTLAERVKMARRIRDEVISAVLRRTVFLAYDDIQFHPMHREIQDYLAASYLARCIQFRRFQDLGERGGTVRVFQLLAQRLDRLPEPATNVFTPQLIDDLWDGTATPMGRSRIVFGHVAVAVANSQTVCSRSFFVALFEKLRTLDELARHIALAALGLRLLKNTPQDDELRSLMKAELRMYVDDNDQLTRLINGRKLGVDVITRSMAWCYLRASSGSEQTIGMLSWKDLQVSRDAVAAATRVFFGPPNDGFLDDKLSLAHQVAFEQLLAAFESDECRPISIAHYLLGFATAYRNGRQLTSSLQTAIRNLFKNKQALGYQSLVNNPQLPELRDVVEIAESML